MPHRVFAFFTPVFIALLASAFFLVSVAPTPVSAYVCGQTGSAPETNSKLQIFVSGERIDETQWAFLITPNPFTLNGSLRIVDNQSIDLNYSLNDLLLEDVCTTVSGETYTVTLDSQPDPVCPLISPSITRSAPQPTPPLSDPQTAAFYFVAECPPATPTPTATATPTTGPQTPTPTSTPACPGAGSAACGTATPTIPSLGIHISPSVISCHGSAQVTVTVTGGDADIVLTTSAGVITPVFARTVNGILHASLNLADVNAGPSANVVTATRSGASASAAFTIASPCLNGTPTIPNDPPRDANGLIIVNQQQQQQQQSSNGSDGANGRNGNNGNNGANGANGTNGQIRISPPSTGDVDWAAVIGR